MQRSRRTFALSLAAVAMATFSSVGAEARTMVFGETWQNGTAAWRTQRANGGDCKGWSQCPFLPSQVDPVQFPTSMLDNAIVVRDHDGADDRDKNTCNGKYVHVPRMYAGWDASNLSVTGGVVQGGNTVKNAQFPVKLDDRLCVVAWVRAYDEGGTEAGPYVGITYTGSHGVVDAGHDHGTHYMIGSMPIDPAGYSTWSGTLRNSYGPMVQVIKDGAWHRYAASFTVDSKDLSTRRMDSPELPGGTTWTRDSLVYGQPRLLLFGKAPERVDNKSLATLPPVAHGADFGDVYIFKADAATASENACPTNAELDAMDFSSDKVACKDGTACTRRSAPLAATDGTPAYPNNFAYQCWGCTESFGGAPGHTTCGAAQPFCIEKGTRGGTCAPCSGDAAAGLDEATRCAATTPTCSTQGSCGKCVTNDDCKNPGDRKVHKGPNCDVTSGACFACTSDHGSGAPEAACSEGSPICDKTTGLCGRRRDDADGTPGGAAHGSGADPSESDGGCSTTHADVSSSATFVGALFALGGVLRGSRRRRRRP